MTALASLPDFQGRYLVERVLSDRERSVSLIVRDSLSGARRFLKVGGPATLSDPLAFRVFRHEPAILRRLERDAGAGTVLPVVDEGMIEGRPYFAQEFAGGFNLAERLRSRRPLDGRSVLQVMTRVLELLQAIHLAGIVHGDISPENIQVVTSEPGIPERGLPPDARIVLVDFETARRFDGPENRPGRPIAGRPSYLAPEIIRGYPLSPRSDLFAVGVVFFELLTGETPYPADALLEPDQAPDFEPSPIPLDLEVPSIVEALARHLIEPDASKRLGSAAEALRELRQIEDLRRWLAGAEPDRFPAEAVTVRTETLPPPPITPSRLFPPRVELPSDGFASVVHEAEGPSVEAEPVAPEAGSGEDFAAVSVDEISLPDFEASGLVRPEPPQSILDDSEPLPGEITMIRGLTDFATEPTGAHRFGLIPAPEPSIPQTTPDAPLILEPMTDLDPSEETSLPASGETVECGVPLIDESAFTVLRPRLLQPGVWMPVIAWIHRANMEPEAEELRLDEGPADPSSLALSQDGGVVVIDEDSSLPAPGCLTLIPHVPGLEFDPPRRELTWTSPIHRLSFRARAGVGLSGRTARGFLSIYWGGFLIGEVRLAIPVDFERATLPAPGFESARDRGSPFRRIFASFSPRDLDVVDRVEQLAANLRDGFVREWLAQRANETWPARFRGIIDRAEVFQLLWSSRSMESPQVRSECDYAISRRRSHFIRPVYWEEPFPKSDNPRLPPDGLRELRFEKLGTATPERIPTDPRLMKLGHPPEHRTLQTISDPLPGLEGILEGYEINHPLGTAGNGSIHLGRHIRSGAQVVIKRSTGREVDPSLYREASQIVGYRFLGVVPVVDAFEQGKTLYVVREYHEGKGLAELLRQTRLNAVQAAELVAGLASRLQHVHRIGRIHRDLKPSNILIDETNQPRLWADHLAAFPKGAFLEYLQGQGFYGTPAYMAPERIAENAQRHEPRSDIYALGIILFEMLTGRCPFVAKDRNLSQLLIRILTEDPPVPSSLASGVPTTLDTICLRCLEKSAEDRYPDAAALAEDLNAWISLETDSGPAT